MNYLVFANITYETSMIIEAENEDDAQSKLESSLHLSIDNYDIYDIEENYECDIWHISEDVDTPPSDLVYMSTDKT